jgi:hypothetical protein
MPRVGFEPTTPTFERAKTVHASDGAAAVIGENSNHLLKICLNTGTATVYFNKGTEWISCNFFWCSQNHDIKWKMEELHFYIHRVFNCFIIIQNRKMTENSTVKLKTRKKSISLLWLKLWEALMLQSAPPNILIKIERSHILWRQWT